MNKLIFKKYPKLNDILSIVIFIILVIIGSNLINTFLFRTFNVIGPSMEPTLHTNDRLIVNRIQLTTSKIQNKAYIPDYGQIVVIKNPRYEITGRDKYIIKRVVGLPGDRVLLSDGKYTVFNSSFPNGFDPDAAHKNTIKSPTDGTVDKVVPNGEIFVSGDNRTGSNSYDSRSGLGTIPLYNLVGVVSLRIYPFTKIQLF